MSERNLSVVVFGASGVTGRHVAAYLAGRAPEVEASWAVAGRDSAKLDRVLGELGVAAPETIVADVSDQASLAAMASRAQVVLDLVGPYTLYGAPVIEACISNGADYVDLTGEIPFVRRTIDAFHDRAVEAGVRVVQTSGFEAMPPDLAVLLAAETARERWGENLAEADAVVSTQQPRGRLGLADLVSGGTLQGFPATLDADGAETLTDPAALIDDPALAEDIRRTSPITVAPRFNSRGDVIAPMTPAAYINPPVLMRTADLLAREQGERMQPFRYREGLAVPGGTASLPFRYAGVAALSGLQAGIGAMTRAQPALRGRAAGLLRRILPASGFGPSGRRLEEWTWQLAVDARTVGGHYVRVDVDADGHPGYLTTPRFLAEAGLMIAEEGATPERAGCLTPAAALGTESLDRLARAGLRFSLSS